MNSTEIQAIAVRLSVPQQESLRDFLRHPYFANKRTEDALVRRGLVSASHGAVLTTTGREVAEYVRDNGVVQSTTLTPTAKKVLEFLQGYLVQALAEYDGAGNPYRVGALSVPAIARRMDLRSRKAGEDAIRRLRANGLVQLFGSRYRAVPDYDQRVIFTQRQEAFMDLESVVSDKLHSAGIAFRTIRESEMALSIEDLYRLISA
jgi:hypothetical protein